MASEAVNAMRAKIAYFGRMLFDRHLTDAGGGNISVRVGEFVCMSATYAGQKHQWQISPEDVLVLDKDGNILEGDGKLSRESKVHLALHREFGQYGTAVMHAHPRNLMVFAAMAKPMPPVLEANLKFGEIQVIEYAPAHSPQLAENVVGGIRGQEQRIVKHGAGVIAPWHGVFLMGKDLDAAFDAVERFDTNAYCILQAHAAFGNSDMLYKERHELAAAAERFGKDV